MSILWVIVGHYRHNIIRVTPEAVWMKNRGRRRKTSVSSESAIDSRYTVDQEE